MLRLIGAAQIIEAERRIAGPGEMHIQRIPGRGARGAPTTTISETNPLMINKDIRQPDPRAALADNVSAEYS